MNRLMRKSKDKRYQTGYFKWLCGLVEIGHSDPERLELAWQLYQKPFYGDLPNDDNRIEDGIKMRQSFCDENPWFDGTEDTGPCNVLEMLIALARRMEHILGDVCCGDRTGKWFWELINNFELQVFLPDDRNVIRKINDNNAILDTWLQRRYMYNGKGGIFPLKKPTEDHRKVEIWYQMMAYLDENYPM